MSVGESVICFVALGCSRPGGITRVEIPSDEVLSTGLRNLTHEVIVIAVWRPYERGRDPEEALESLVDALHLAVDLVRVKGGEVWMAPRVRGDHVTITIGILNAFNALWVVDATVCRLDVE